MESGEYKPTALDDYWARVYAKPKEQVVTAEQFSAMFIETANRMTFAGRPFVVDEHNAPVIALVSQYFTGDKSYEQNGRCLQKGICLMGSVGTGKTFIFEVAHQVLLRIQSPVCLRLVHVNELEQGYSSQGNIIFDQFGRTFRQKTQNEINDTSRPITVILDDMGSESGKACFWGNKVDVVSELIIERYKHIRIGMVTHATTNLEQDEIFERYGKRSFDRMLDLMDFIDLGGKSRRGAQ
jgi:DNA replication protein DnaC